MRKILINHPIISSILYVVIAMVIPFSVIYPMTKGLPYYFPAFIKYSITLVISILLIISIYKGYRYKIDNTTFFKRFFSYGGFGLIYALMAFIFSYSNIYRVPDTLEVISYILYVLMIAISEEALFRVLILNAILNIYKTRKKGVLFSVTIASVIFGIRHFLNLVLYPNTPISTIGQVIFTFMAGFYLSCLYIRTMNPFFGIIIHFVENFSTMFWGLLSLEALNNQNIDAGVFNVVLLVSVHSFYIVVGFQLLKKYFYKNLMKGIM